MCEIERFVALPTDDIIRQVRALGIDLGTTNSTVSGVVWDYGILWSSISGDLVKKKDSCECVDSTPFP